MSDKLRVGFVHPDLGIGGAERLVVDAALGLQQKGHVVEIYTSHHDPSHCFEETKDGTLKVNYVKPPFFLPRSILGRFHIVCAHLRQLHLVLYLLFVATKCDIYFVDQLSTCVPFLRTFLLRRVVFYCHFPDKLLADGEYVAGSGGQLLAARKRANIFKTIYRFPMDWWEEWTTKQADLLLANSEFTVEVMKRHFTSITAKPTVVYPGVNVAKYTEKVDEAQVQDVISTRPTFISFNRFEAKKNVGLAISAFAHFKKNLTAADKSSRKLDQTRLVIGGGFDPRVKDNLDTLDSLVKLAESSSLTFHLLSTVDSPRIQEYKTKQTPAEKADILFILNYTSLQRSALLQSPRTIALLYTPNNEHFGIGPVEGMVCGVPVIACDSGGPRETVVNGPAKERTGWLKIPQVGGWADAMKEAARLDSSDRSALSTRAKRRVEKHFTLEKLADGMETALKQANVDGTLSVLDVVDLEWFLVAFMITIAFVSVKMEVMEPTAAAMLVVSYYLRKLFSTGIATTGQANVARNQ